MGSTNNSSDDLGKAQGFKKSSSIRPMKVLLLYPEFPDTFWSFKHAVKFIHKKAALPPLAVRQAEPKKGKVGANCIVSQARGIFVRLPSGAASVL